MVTIAFFAQLCSSIPVESNEKIVVLEERHKDRGLKDLGASEIPDRLTVISWRICDEEHVLLKNKDVVRDVLKFPKHSKDSPQFVGSCQLNGHDLPGKVIGVLKNEHGVANPSGGGRMED